MIRGYEPGMGPCRVFHGALGKMIESARQAATSLQQELLSLRLKQVGMDRDLLKTEADIGLDMV